MGNKEYFKGIPKIEYEGKESDNSLAFKYYKQALNAAITPTIKNNHTMPTLTEHQQYISQRRAHGNIANMYYKFSL